MKVLYILLLGVFVNISFGQSLSNLDAKNGFRHFKFGTFPSQIENIEKLDREYSKSPYVTFYRYVGKDIEYLHDVKINYIDLTFYNNKLCGIQIVFGDFDSSKTLTSSEFKRLLYALEQTYGKDWIYPEDRRGILINGAIWDAKNITLELLKFDLSKDKSDPRDYELGYISISHKRLYNQIYTNEF
ncbi:hypothetical protein ACI76Y_01945 [Capnocytophaga cynodegmi]|uniref:hypothetical protein n=1 Tax=Capnocytophaga cynodegmi TaxID=28189 RepID=UPI003859D921